MTEYKKNITISYLTTFLGGLEFALPIMTLYYEQELGTIFLVTVILSFKSAATVLLEVPTGILTDQIGRKSTLIISRVCGVLYLILLLIGSNLEIFLLAMAVGSISSTLASGTMTSLIYESVERMEEENPTFKRVIAITHSLWPIGASIASVIGGFLATINLRLPIALMLLPLIISTILITQLNDPFDKINTDDKESSNYQEESIWKKTKEAIKILKENKQVLILIGIGFFSYIGEVAHSLKPIYFAFKGIELYYFGFLFGMTFGFSFLGSLLSDPLTKKFENKKTLIIMSILSEVFVLVSILSSGLISGVLLTLSSLSWGIQWPIISELLNNELQNETRTTVLSVDNMFKMLSFSLFGPIFGYLVDLYTVQTLYWIEWIISLFLIVPFFFLRDS